jgi:putative DNA primase/helicase
VSEDFDAEWEDVLRDLDEDLHEDHHDPDAVEDAHIAETVAERALRDRFCWTSGLGWMVYRRGRWVPTTDATVAEQVRRDLIEQHAREARAGAKVDRLKRLTGLLSATRIRAIASLARGILEVEDAAFDQHPHLLNVGNGVVDLSTGELLDHDPDLLLTKATAVEYVPDAWSADWTAALDAVPEEVASWLQVRVGQAATGHPTPDDLLCVLQGSGSNGKTTITGAIHRALGDHAVVVPERLLLANPSDHPTELMTLRGARMAMIEETPEARHLSVKRLKDTVGTPTMTARLIRHDNVTWEATHSLFLTTNYLPRIDETDHGTWRRLAMVRFPYRFTNPQGTADGAPDEVPVFLRPRDGEQTRVGVPGLRERLREGRHGQHEAVLAWIVDGARRWYELDREMPPIPPPVRDDTAAWRAEADLICGYLSDRLILDPGAHVMSTELFTDFSTWITARGHKPWSDQTFTARFADHDTIQDARVEKRQISPGPGLSRPFNTPHHPTGRYTAWLGVRYRTSIDGQSEVRP